MNIDVIPPENIYLVTDIPGYTPGISRLLYMMNYVRFVTLYHVKDLSASELDFQIDEKSNSIGALLLHIASTEYFYQKMTFEERDMTDEENKEWGSAFELGEKGRQNIKGNDLKYYLNKLNEIRSTSYKLFREKDDIWLEKKLDYGKYKSNNYHLWFHVFEDEINHRGQISWIRKRIKSEN